MRKKQRVMWLMLCILLYVLFSYQVAFAVEETGGIGLKISQLYDYTTTGEDKRGSLVVLDVFKGSPAHQGGIEKGDIILQIDNVFTRKRDFRELLEKLLRGPSFTDVTLVIWRPSKQERIEMKLQRTTMVY